MKPGDLIKDEFGNIGILTELRGDHVFVQFPTWNGWSLTWLFEAIKSL